jgi:type III secretory pathway lipoprotein EscJ
VSALAFLDSHRVLPSRSAHASKTSKGGLVPSREEQWFSYQRAVAHSIEDTLNTLAGVLEAHVHVNLPEHDPLLGRKRDVSGTGSVLLVIDERFVTTNEEVSALVAGAAGVPAAQVTVLKSLAASEPVSVQASVESSVAAPASCTQTPEVLTELPQVMNWVSPEIACVAAASFVCGAAGLMAVRRRVRRRTRFTLPNGGEDEQ